MTVDPAGHHSMPPDVAAAGPAGTVADPDTAASEGRGLYWLLRHVLLGPVVRRAFMPIAEGVQHVPASGPAIIVSNHLSYTDWIFMPLVLPRRVTFPAKSDYFTGGGFKGRFQRTFFKGTGQVPIDRSGGSASRGALDAGLRVLERGELFGIYPEGTRSHDGRLYKGRTGVARLALTAAVPVIPCGVVGTDKIAPPGKIVASFESPIVRFGQPLDFSRYDGMADDRLILRAVTDEIMYRIMELSGQEYVDMYATTAKQQAGRATTGAPRVIIQRARDKARDAVSDARAAAGDKVAEVTERVHERASTRAGAKHAEDRAVDSPDQSSDDGAYDQAGPDHEADPDPGAVSGPGTSQP